MSRPPEALEVLKAPEVPKHNNPRLPPSWQLTRLLKISKAFNLLEAFRPPKVLKPPGTPEHNNLRPYNISLLYGLVYSNLPKQVNNYTILPPRHYINGPINPDKINKFLKI